MFRVLKRLAILGALWLGVSVAGVVYINTRSPEQFETEVRAVLEPTLGALDAAFESAVSINSPEFAPLPADDVMRAEAETTLAEVEALYDQLIATHQALQEAHTDEWEKRWAGDAVTIARIDRERAVEAIRTARRDVDHPSGPLSGDMTPQAVSSRLDAALIAAAWHHEFVEEELATAKEKLRAAEAAP